MKEHNGINILRIHIWLVSVEGLEPRPILYLIWDISILYEIWDMRYIYEIWDSILLQSSLTYIIETASLEEAMINSTLSNIKKKSLL